MTITLRAAVPDDVPTLVDFIRQLAAYERLSEDCHAAPDKLAQHLFGPRPSAEAVVAAVEGQSVGFALFFHTYSTFLTQPGMYLEDLFVVPSARGQGVGRALLAHLAALAVQRGCGRMEWSVLDWNTPAIGFYTRLGALPMRDWTVFRLTADALTALAAAHAVG